MHDPMIVPSLALWKFAEANGLLAAICNYTLYNDHGMQ